MGRCTLASFYASMRTSAPNSPTDLSMHISDSQAAGSMRTSDAPAALSVAQYPLVNSAALDSGSNIDIFNQISRFLNFRAAPPGDFLWAGEQKVPIQGYGDIDVELEGPGGTSIFRVYDAAYCENFACNLISLRKLEKRGFWWDHRRKCVRRADGSILAYVKDRYDQYILEDIPEEVTRSVFFTRRNKFNSYSKRRPQYAYARIWHLRLGHPGPETLKHLVNASQGVRIRGLKTVEYDHCGTAKIRRQTRRTPRFENKPPLKRGERFAIDFHDWEEDDEGYSSLMLVINRYFGWS